jgi:hypothetical protein
MLSLPFRYNSKQNYARISHLHMRATCPPVTMFLCKFSWEK